VTANEDAPRRKSDEGKCTISGCYHDGEWVPVLVMEKAACYEGRTVRAELHLPFCTGCMRTLTLNDVLSPESWRTMEETFLANGKMMPDKDQIQLDWKHMLLGYAN